MKIEDLHKLKLGDMLICTQTVTQSSWLSPKSEIKRGQIFYFITYYNRVNIKPTLYLSKVPINSNANPSDSYEPAIIEYFETANQLREEKINIILK